MKKILLNLLLVFVLSMWAFNVSAQVTLIADITEGCVPLEVEFTAIATGGVTYEFSFLDESITDSVASHTLNSAADGNVFVNVYDEFGSYIGYDNVTIDLEGPSSYIYPNYACPETDITIEAWGVSTYSWDFGDGSTSDEQYTTHSYSTFGKFPVSLTYSSDNCASKTVVIDSIEITDAITMEGTYDVYGIPATICPADQIYVSAYGYPNEGNVSSINWDFGDNTSDEGNYLNHQYSEVGEYIVTATFANGCGNDTSISDTVIVTNDLPFNGSPSIYLGAKEICPNTKIDIHASSGYNSYHWEFGNGKTDNTWYTETSYDDVGEYYITLTITDPCGSDTVLYDTIYVVDDITIDENVSYDISPTKVCPFIEVDFEVTGVGINSVLWQFGDGNISRNAYTDHKYHKQGIMPVSVTLQNGCGSDTTFKDTVYVGMNKPVQGEFKMEISNTEVCPGDIISFNTVYNAFETVELDWDLGDGTILYDVGFEHSYDTPGDYTVTLTFTNNCGTDTVLIDTIHVVDNQDIDGSFSISILDKEICPGDAPLFILSSNSNGTISWNFGDGTTENGNYLTHQYTTVGKYAITATFTNNCGKDTVLTDTVEVIEDKTITSLFINHTSVACTSTAVNFNAFGGIYDVRWNFGDGSTDEGKDVDHTYNTAGIYEIIAIGTNNCGDTIADTSEIKIVDYIEIAGNYFGIDFWNNKTVCPNTSISMEPNYWADNVESFVWEISDGTIYDGDYYVHHEFTEVGTNYIHLTFKNSCGGDTTVVDSVIVVDDMEFDYISIYKNKDAACPGEDIRFSLSASNIESIAWEIGDEVVGENWSLYHSFDEVGIYTISVTATNYCGNDSTVTIDIEIVDDIMIPEINAYASKYHLCPGEELDFGVEGDYASVTWNLGDGTITNDKYPEHVYETVGVYDVEVTVSNYCGDQFTYYMTIYVEEEIEIRDVEFYYNNHVCPGVEIEFNVQGSFISYIWNFGDGSVPDTTDGSYVYYSYNEAGEYIVTLTVENNCGNTGTATGIVVINDDNMITSVDVSVDEVVCPNSEVDFHLWGSYLYESVEWNFGDGNTSDEIFPTHIYTELGTYTISVTVTNFCGNSFSDTGQIVVANDVEIDYLGWFINEGPVCPNSEVYLYGNRGFTSYLWDFGDGNTSDERFNLHEYASAGTYNVSLTVTNACGNSETKEGKVVVETNLPITDLDIEAIPEKACPGDKILFEVDVDAFSMATWNFGGGTILEGEHVNHAFDAAGTFDIEVIVENTCNSKDTVELSYEVGNDAEPKLYRGDNYGVMEQSICPGDNVLFYVFPSGLGDYSIDFGDGSAAVTETEIVVSDEEAYDVAEHTYSTAGIYEITFTFVNSCGNKYVGTVDVEVIEDVDVYANLDVIEQDEYCTQTDIVFQASGGGSYEWDFGDGSNVITEVTAFSEVMHQYSKKGNYVVSLIISNSCGAEETIIDTLKITCGEDIVENVNLLSNQDFAIYPNPSTKYIYIESNRKISGDANITVFDLVGNKLYNTLLLENKQKVDISTFEPGIYILEIRSETGSVNTKIVKK